MLLGLRFNTENPDHILWMGKVPYQKYERTKKKEKRLVRLRQLCLDLRAYTSESQMIQRRPEKNVEGNSEEAEV